MLKDSFIFYRSFYEAIKDLKDKDRVKIYDAICEKSLNDKEIALTGLSSNMFTLIKPQLEANIKKYENGKKGGRPKKETETKPNENQTKTLGFKNEKANQNQNKTLGFEKDIKNKNQNETETKPNENEECRMQNENEECRMQNEEKLQQLFIKCLNSYNTFAIEECISFLDDLPCEIIEEALKKTGRIKQPNWNYCKSILDDWVKKNIDTIEKVNAENQEDIVDEVWRDE